MNEENKINSTKILELMKSSKKVLLHCHPYADPDSICSVLAMTMALKKMNVEVTPIAGDSGFTSFLSFLPHNDWIEKINFGQVNIDEFDLFIILDSSSTSQITRLQEVVFPETLKTVVIDHHVTNQKFGNINLVETSYSSTCEVLFDLFTAWEVEIDSDMAICLFMGIFADTGGFKYQNTSPKTIQTAAYLAKIYPNYHKFVFDIDNSRKPEEIEMMGLALSSIEKYFSDRVVLSVIPYGEIKERGYSKEQAMEGLIGNTLKSVVGWDLVASLVEAEPGVVTVSLRTRDENKFDVSLVVKAIGEGGGHKAAAGTTIYEPLEIAKAKLLEIIGKTFPEFSMIHNQ